MTRSPLLPKRRPRSPPLRERVVGTILLVVLGITVGFFFWTGTGEGPPRLPEREVSAAPAPSGGPWPLVSPTGWPRGEVDRYGADTLFEKINGKAESYLVYDFRSLSFASYAAPTGDGYVDVYLYDMGTPLDAFGIYRAQRSGDEAPAGLGDEGVRAGLAVFARQGQYYVEALAGTEAAAAEGLGLMRTLLDGLPKAEAAVTPPEGLPAEGLRTVRFDRRNALGVEALADAFVALYRDGTKIVVAAYADAAAAEAAAKEAEEMLAFLGEDVSSGIADGRLVLLVGRFDPERREAILDAVLGLAPDGEEDE